MVIDTYPSTSVCSSCLQNSGQDLVQLCHNFKFLLEIVHFNQVDDGGIKLCDIINFRLGFIL